MATADLIANAAPNSATTIAPLNGCDTTLLTLAHPVLLALVNVAKPVAIGSASAQRTLLLSAVRKFQRSCIDADIPRETAHAASYCLCAALDEAAMRTPWGRDDGQGGEWITQGLCLTLHGDRQGADQFYRLLDREVAAPEPRGDLLALMNALLNLGFQGRYRFERDGQRKSAAIKRRLDAAILEVGNAQRQDAAPAATIAQRPRTDTVEVSSANTRQSGTDAACPPVEARQADNTRRRAVLVAVAVCVGVLLLIVAAWSVWHRPSWFDASLVKRWDGPPQQGLTTPSPTTLGPSR